MPTVEITKTEEFNNFSYGGPNPPRETVVSDVNIDGRFGGLLIISRRERKLPFRRGRFDLEFFPVVMDRDRQSQVLDSGVKFKSGLKGVEPGRRMLEERINRG